jgi:hypothetical protein
MGLRPSKRTGGVELRLRSLRVKKDRSLQGVKDHQSRVEGQEFRIINQA